VSPRPRASRERAPSPLRPWVAARPAVAASALVAALAVGFATAALAVAKPWDEPLALWHPSVVVHHAPCPDRPDSLGCADAENVWVRPGIGRWWSKWTYLHELGHTVDFAMGAVRREAVRRVAGWRRWYTERFANAWARCAASERRRLCRHLP
jgi:hypothetical protein